MPSLFLVRHGKTLWTKEKRFTGWGNAPLSDKGIAEALSAARALKSSNHSFDICFTSCLERAKHTAQIINDELNMPVANIQYEWRLNERHYGSLQGELRSDMLQKHGPSNVMSWRNTFKAIPPEFTEDDPRWLEQLERLPEVPRDQHPRSESMFQATQRTMTLWNDQIAPALKAEKNILIIAHTNSIRAISSHIEDFNEKQSALFRIQTAVPRHYELNDDLKPLKMRDLSRSPKVQIINWLTRKVLKRVA